MEEIDFEDEVKEEEIDSDVVEEVEEEIEKEETEKEEKEQTELDDKVEDEEKEDEEKEDDKLEEGFSKFLKKGYVEDLQKTKQEIDKMNRQGKEASEIKDTITMMADDEKEETAAKEYAISKIKESLFNSQYNCKLANLNR